MFVLHSGQRVPVSLFNSKNTFRYVLISVTMGMYSCVRALTWRWQCEEQAVTLAGASGTALDSGHRTIWRVIWRYEGYRSYQLNIDIHLLEISSVNLWTDSALQDGWILYKNGFYYVLCAVGPYTWLYCTPGCATDDVILLIIVHPAQFWTLKS